MKTALMTMMFVLAGCEARTENPEKSPTPVVVGKTEMALQEGAAKKKRCDDGNVCTKDRWSRKRHKCVHIPVVGSCDDGNACTTADTCKAGKCVGTTKLVDDGNACTNDWCDPKTGTISSVDNGLCPPQGLCPGGDYWKKDQGFTKNPSAGKAEGVYCPATAGYVVFEFRELIEYLDGNIIVLVDWHKSSDAISLWQNGEANFPNGRLVYEARAVGGKGDLQCCCVEKGAAYASMYQFTDDGDKYLQCVGPWLQNGKYTDAPVY